MIVCKDILFLLAIFDFSLVGISNLTKKLTNLYRSLSDLT